MIKNKLMVALIMATIFVTLVFFLLSCESSYDFHDEYSKMEQKLEETSRELDDLKWEYEKLKEEKEDLEWQVWDLQEQLEAQSYRDLEE